MVRKDGRLDGEEDGEGHSKMRFWEDRLEDRVYPLQKKAADRWDSSWWWWWESQWSTRRWRWRQVCRWDPPERATFQVMSLMPQDAIYVKIYLSVFTKKGRNTVPAYLPIYLEQGRNIGFIFIYSANVSKCLFCITLPWGRWTRCIPCFTEPTQSTAWDGHLRGLGMMPLRCSSQGGPFPLWAFCYCSLVHSETATRAGMKQ